MFYRLGFYSTTRTLLRTCKSSAMVSYISSDLHLTLCWIIESDNFFLKPTKPTSRKSRSHSSRSVKKSGLTPQKQPKKKSVSANPPKTEVDLLSTAAMENLFYISHNAAQCLEFRGFGWPKESKSRHKAKSKKRKNKK